MLLHQKLEDLVRLALKRLNVSYLTEYRHVWYGLRRGCSRVSVSEAKLDGCTIDLDTFLYQHDRSFLKIIYMYLSVDQNAEKKMNFKFRRLIRRTEF